MLVIPEAYVGHLAGLATSGLWTFTSMFFTEAARRLGPTFTNAIRILMAVVLLGATHRMLAGAWWPDALPRQVWLLAASGIVGLAIGDQALFHAFVWIGPRLSMVIETTAPLMAALLGWVVLGERISAVGCLGIACTVGGVGWVVCERPRRDTPWPSQHRLRGILLAILAAACQATGLLLSKQGMGNGWLPREEQLVPQAATFVRMTFAAAGMLPFLAIDWARRGRLLADRSPTASEIRSGLLFAAAGAIGGPFLGVWMSLVAADRVPLGVAQTLCTLPPVLILPFARLLYREHIGTRAVLGAVIAVAGVALLFMPLHP